MFRKLLAVLMCVFTFCSGVGVHAAVPETIVPMYDNVRIMSNELSFEGTTGIAESSVSGKSGTTKIRIIFTVYKETDDGWKYVDHDSITVYDTEASLSLEFEAEYGTNYKSVLSITVTANGTSESVLDEAFESYP